MTKRIELVGPAKATVNMPNHKHKTRRIIRQGKEQFPHQIVRTEGKREALRGIMRKNFLTPRGKIAHDATKHYERERIQVLLFPLRPPLKCDPCYAGRQIQCPACNHVIKIPNPPAGTGFTHVQPESGRTWDTHVPKARKVSALRQQL